MFEELFEILGDGVWNMNITLSKDEKPVILLQPIFSGADKIDEFWKFRGTGKELDEGFIKALKEKHSSVAEELNDIEVMKTAIANTKKSKQNSVTGKKKELRKAATKTTEKKEKEPQKSLFDGTTESKKSV